MMNHPTTLIFMSRDDARATERGGRRGARGNTGGAASSRGKTPSCDSLRRPDAM